MRAMQLDAAAPIDRRPLRLREVPIPVPAAGDVLIRVEVCAACRTDLHVVEGDLPFPAHTVTPGHQIVGRVAGARTTGGRLREGDRVGVAWLHAACGTCTYCHRGAENLCVAPRFTGYDVPGGYADYLTAPEAFVYPLPAALPAEHLAPLLCAGIIGYRALCRSGVRPGQKLGLWGFGASAHVVIQIARYWGCAVFVATRGERHRALARDLGATWVGDATAIPPEPLDAGIVFAPAGTLVPPALAALDRGGTLALAGIHMSEIPPLDYARSLFYERTLRSVTANTREDGRELLELAAAIPLHTHTESFALEDANEALYRLQHDEIRGAAVLRVL